MAIPAAPAIAKAGSGIWASVAGKASAAFGHAKAFGGTVGTHVMNHKAPYLIGGTVAAVAYSRGKHTERVLAQQQATQSQGNER